MIKTKSIVITGGGTGGHLSVAKSLIDEFYELGYDIIFIGSNKGADKSWFEYEKKLSKAYFFNTKGVVNQKIFGKIKSLFFIFIAMIRTIIILKKHNAFKVISVGGFSAA